ncbi:thioredoxin family protein [Candidatus Latescibacterota bacterium]
MKFSVYFLLFIAFGFLVLSCGQSDEQANADGNVAVQTAQTSQPVQPAGNIVVSTASLDENNWYHDWNEGLAAAAKEGKPIIVDFYTDWCKWCKVMDAETFSNPEVMDIMTKGWIKIKINAEDGEKKGTYKEQTLEYNRLAAAFGVRAYPSYLFFDKKGQPITIVPNFWEKEKFIPILDYFTKELYTKEIDLQEYIESKS